MNVQNKYQLVLLMPVLFYILNGCQNIPQVLLRASGIAMMSTITVKEGKQTWIVHADYGHLELDTVQP